MVTIITDSLTINSVWYRAHSDFFLVANEPTADILVKAGIPEQKIRIFGFPVPRIFASLDGSRPCPTAGWPLAHSLRDQLGTPYGAGNRQAPPGLG